MSNAGPPIDLSMLYILICCLFIPMIAQYVIEWGKHLQNVQHYIESQIPPQVPKTKTVVLKVENNTPPVKTKSRTQTNQIQSRTTRKSKKQKTVKPKEKTKPHTDKSIVNETVAALSNLGFKKRESKVIVEKLCSVKEYSSTELLIKDCLTIS